MYNMEFNRYGFGMNHSHNCGCGCKPEIFNFYRHPAPIEKRQKLLDVKQVTIHTDNNIRKACVRGACCEPERVVVKEAKKSLVLTACTDCLKPGEYYTLNVDREIPIEAYPFDTYINVEPEDFNSFRGEVGLVYTEVDHFGGRIGTLFDNVRDNLPSVEIDGENTYVQGGEVPGTGEHFEDERWDGFEHNGPIPEDPAFPCTPFCGCGFKANKGVLIPVSLDIHGNIANGRNFATGRFKNPGTGAPYCNRFVLFLNNRGEFVLSRSSRRRSDYA